MYDKSQSYHLLYEDRSKALFLPSSKKEIFMLSRLQDKVGKDFKRISLYPCFNYDFQVSKGYFDDEFSNFTTDGDVIIKTIMGSEKPFKSTRCNSPSDLTAVPGEGAN